MNDLKDIPAVHRKGLLKTFRVFTQNPLAFLRDEASLPGGISCFRLLHHRIVYVSQPDFIRHILLDKDGIYTQSRDRDHMQLLFGKGLLTSTGKHWQKQRALIQPCFGPAQLEALFAKILAEARAFPLQTGSGIDIHAYALDIVNRVIAAIIFSDTSAKTLATGNILVTLKADTLKRLSDFALPLWLPTPRNTRYKKQRAAVYRFLHEQIAARKKSGEKKNDLLDSFLEARDKTSGRGMTEDELAEELLGIYAAAHEPVAIALSYTFFLLAQNPGAEQRLCAELSAVFSKGELRLEHFGELVFTKQLVQEALRLYPPVWISGRRALKADVIGGYRIRKNDNFIYCPALLHRHPDFWDDPDRFDPSRFEAGKKQYPFSYLPFSGGAKFCVGSHLALMILQVLTATTLQKVSLAAEVNSVDINPFTTLKPVNDLLFTVRRREPAGAQFSSRTA